MESVIKKIDLEKRIFLFQGQRVMIDRDLATLYHVSTKALNQAVKRNSRRFPAGFMFRLTQRERNELVTNCDRLSSLKHATHRPLAFTDYGVAMLSSVLHSQRAIKVNIEIIRVFIKLRSMVTEHRRLSEQLTLLEKRIDSHDTQIRAIFEAIRELIRYPKGSQKEIGFRTK